MTEIERRLKKAEQSGKIKTSTQTERSAASSYSETSDTARRLRIAEEQNRKYSAPEANRRATLQRKTESWMDLTTEAEPEARAAIDRYKATEDAKYYAEMNQRGATIGNDAMQERGFAGYKRAAAKWREGYHKGLNAKPVTDETLEGAQRKQNYWAETAKQAAQFGDQARYNMAVKNVAKLQDDQYNLQMEENERQREEYEKNLEALRQSNPAEYYALTKSDDEIGRLIAYFDYEDKKNAGRSAYGVTRTPEEETRLLRGMRQSRFVGESDADHDAAVRAEKERYDRAVAAYKNRQTVMDDTTGRTLRSVADDPHWVEYFDRTPEEEAEYLNNLRRARFAGESDAEREAYIQGEKDRYAEQLRNYQNGPDYSSNLATDMINAESNIKNLELAKSIHELERVDKSPANIEAGRAALREQQGNLLTKNKYYYDKKTMSHLATGAGPADSRDYQEMIDKGWVLYSDFYELPEDQQNNVYAVASTDPEKAVSLAQHYLKLAEDEHYQKIHDWVNKDSGWQFGRRALGMVGGTAAKLVSGLDPYGTMGQGMSKTGNALISGGAASASRSGLFGIEFLGGDESGISSDVPFIGKGQAGLSYQVGASVLQSAAIAAPAMIAGNYSEAAAKVAETIGLVLMGSSAAADDYTECIDKGMTVDQARIHATAAGVAEAAFERISLENLIHPELTTNALKRWLQQAGIEASEEVVTSIANRISDELLTDIYGVESDVDRRTRELVADGLSYNAARGKAENEWIADVIQDGMSGFLSGLIMGGGSEVIRSVANKGGKALNVVETRKEKAKTGAAVSRSDGSVEALQAYAKDNGIEIKAVETAEQNAGESAEQGEQSAAQNSYSNRDYRSISDTNSKVVQSIRSEVRGKTVQEQQTIRDSLVEKYGEGIAPVVNHAISVETAASVRQEYGNVDSIQAARNQAVSEIKDESLRQAVSDGYDSAAYALAANQGGESGMNTMSRYIQQRRNTGSGSEMSMNATVTAQDGSTKTIAITGMSEDGKRVSLADGSEVAVKDLQADADTTSAIQQLADLDLGADATKVLEAYQQSGVTGTDGYRWLMDYATAYNQGRTRQISLEQAAQRSSLDERTVMDAYTLGQQSANRETQAGLEKLKNLPKRKGASGRTANIDTTEIKGKTMSKSELEQFELANQYAQALGVDMTWFSSKEKDGKFIGKNGAYENGTIYMDIHAGRNFTADITSGILATMGHELTHFQQQYAPGEYQAIKEFLFEQIVKSSPNGEARLERLIWEKQRRSGNTLSRKAAEDEVVADACQKMLRDSKAVHDFASQQPEAANGLVRWLDKWFKKVRSIFGRGGNYSEEAQIMDSLEQDVKAAFGELWDKALKQAAKVHDEVGNIEKPATENETNEKNEAQNSDRDAEYLELAKDPENNAARLQEMVDEAAKAAGYTIKAYHGRGENFNVFDREKIGSMFPAVSTLGFYFTPYEEDAKGYASNWNVGKTKGNVLSAFLKMKNPLVVSDEGWGSAATQADIRRGDLSRWAKEGKHDGIIVNSTDEEDTVYIVFESNQIKSADPVTYDDSGKVIPLSERFNRENQDIRFSERDYSTPSDEELLMNAKVEDAESPEARAALQNSQKQARQIRDLTRRLERLQAEIRGYEGDSPNRISVQRFTRQALDLFGIPTGVRTDMGELLQSVAEGVLAGHNLSQNDIMYFFETLITNGREKTVADETLAEIRDDLKGRKIYVNENVKAEFGDDWNAFRKRAFSLGIQLTNNEKNMGIDSVNAELAELYPGKFDAGETDLRSILENIVDTTESGKTSDVPILDAMREIQKQTGEPVREQLQTMLDQFTRQIEIMQDQAAVERKARAGNAAEIAKARKQINEAKEALREVRKQRNAWKRKSEGADARQKRALDAALRGIVQHDAKQIAEAVRQKQTLAKKLQDQIDRENKILSGKLRAPELVKMLKAERERAETRVREQKEAQFARYKEGKKAGELRGRISALKKNLQNSLLHPTDTNYVPAGLAKSIVDALDALDTSPKEWTKSAARYAAISDKLRAVAIAYNDMHTDNEVGYEYTVEYDQELSKMISNLAKTMEGRNARDLSADELKTVYDYLRSIRDTMVEARKILSNLRYASVREAIVSGLEQQSKITPIDDVSKLERKKRLSVMDKRSPMRAVEFMSDMDRSAALYEAFQQVEAGDEQRLAWSLAYQNDFRELKTGKNEKTYWQSLTKQIDYGATDKKTGKHVTMTKMQAIQMFMTAQREAANKNLEHFFKGGATIRNAIDIMEGKGNIRSNEVFVTPELLKNIENSFTEWDRQYMSRMRDYLKREGKAVNNVFYKLKHRVLALEENYVPTIVDQKYLDAKLETTDFSGLFVKSPRSTKPITEGAPQPLIIDGMETMMNKHVQEQAQYIGMATAIRDFAKIFNGKVSINDNGVGYTSLKAEIERNFGKKGVHLITQALIDIQGGSTQSGWRSGLEKVIKKLQTAFVRHALLLNLSVTIKQAASYVAAGSIISREALLKGNRTILNKNEASHSASLITQIFLNPNGKTAQEIFARIDKYTALHADRRNGMNFAEIELGQKNYGKLRQKAAEIGANLEQKKGGHKVREIGAALNPASWIQRMDVATTAALFVACEYQARMDGLEGEAYHAKVKELYERVLRETQPMYDSLHRTAQQKSGGSLAQYLFPFRTVPIQNHGQMASAYDRLLAAKTKSNTEKAEAAKFFRKTLLAQIESAVVFSAMTFAAALTKRKTKKYRDEDGELTLESVARGFGLDVASTLVSVASPMWGSELWSLSDRFINKFTGKGGYTYDSFSVGALDMINDTAAAIDRIAADVGKATRREDVSLKEFGSHLFSLLTKVGNLSGIPADTIKTYTEGFIGNIQDAIEGRIPALNDESWERDAATNARRYLKAYLDNDTKKANAVLAELRSNLSKNGKDEEKINEAIRKYVSAQAVEKVADGTWTEEEAEAYLLSTGAYDDRENPQKDAWNAIRKGVAKSTSTGEEYSWKQYDELAEAVANGEDVTGLLTEYRNHGYSDDQINAAIRSGIQEAMTAGDFDEKEAADALIRYKVTYSKDGKTVAYDKQSAWKKVQEWADKAEHTDEEGELEEGYKYSAYSDLFEAVDANKKVDGIIQTMTRDGGYDEDSLRSQIKEHLRERFISGQISETALKNQLSRYCKITKAEDANEIVANAKCKRDFGVYPDDLKEAFKDGDLSQNQAEKALQQYKGLSKTDAQNRVQYWSYDGDLSENAWLKWNKDLKSSGLSVENWEKVSKVKSDAKGTDANGDGRADSGTVKAEVVSYIDSMDIPKSQKKAIYLAFGWAASTMPSWR